jgi:signal transduction histidine kinase
MYKSFSYTKKVNLLALLLIAGIVIFTYREYAARIEQQKQLLLNEFNDIQSDLSLEARLISKFVGGARDYAQNYLHFNKNETSIWVSHLKYDPKYSGAYLQDLPKDYANLKMGNLTTHSSHLLETADKKREVMMALKLGEYFSAGLKSIPKSPWFYYISSDFMYLSPYVPPSDFFFDRKIIVNKEFYKNALPGANPDRKGFWTSVYLDEAGYGLMVTYSEPVYEADHFVGAISMDVTLDQFNEVLNRRSQMGSYVLINAQNQILAEPKTVSSADKKITMASEHIPEDLLKRIRGPKQDPLEDLERQKSNFVFYRDFPEFNATLVFFLPAQKLFMDVFRQLLGVNVAFMLCLLLILKLRLVILNDYRLQQNLIQNAKMAALGQMASGMAHEINNPLAIISGRSSLLLKALEKGDPPDVSYMQESLSKILKTSKRIEKIIHGLKSFSRKSDTDLFQATSLSELINSTLELCNDTLYQRGIKLKLSEVPDVVIMARESQLSQVLLNLLNNSMDALANCTVKEISISFQQTDFTVSIFVRDTGPAIPPDVQARLMEPFFTTKNPGSGTGLGLSISLGIMQEHKGKLYFSAGGPTCFVMEVPLA